MTDAIRTLVVLAEHADRQLVEQALEGDSSIEVVGYADALDDWRASSTTRSSIGPTGRW
jgi:hypothetical protein